MVNYITRPVFNRVFKPKFSFGSPFRSFNKQDFVLIGHDIEDIEAKSKRLSDNTAYENVIMLDNNEKNGPNNF